MLDKEKIIELVRQKGLCLPADIYKELETNQLFASAMLGELVSNGVLKVTDLKRGSSPYYYLEEQKEKLQNLVEFLNDKDKIAYNLIKENFILKDSDQSPLIRVALRSIKDFAVPIQVNYNGNQIVFWRWYLLSKEETEEKVKSLLGIKEQKPIKHTKDELKKEIQQKIVEKIKQPIKKIMKQKSKSVEEDSSPFLDKLKKYFDKNNINVLEQEYKNRTKTEIDFIIELPSAFGNLQYYCKSKNKKKINDADIASAMVQGQQKKLPTLVLITGDMTKKSEEMLEKEFKGIKVHKI